MRIGLFTDQYYPIVSGVSTSIKMLYEGLTEMGHECFIFTCMDSKMLDDDKNEYDKRIINIPGRPYPFKNIKDYRYTFFHRRFIKKISEYKLDIIHVHTEYNIAKLAIKASKALHIPLVHTFHTLWEEYFSYLSPFFDTFFHSQMRRTLIRLFTGPLAKSSVIEIVPTNKVLSLSKFYGLSSNIKVIPTGIDFSSFYSKNISEDSLNELRDNLGIAKNDFVFLYLGRISPEKNIPSILKAFSRLSSFKNVKLLIVGGGPQLDELKKLAGDLGISEYTIFTDMVPHDKASLYYQLGNVFVNCSKSETQGLTYIEALASNVPVVVQLDGCLDDVVIDGYNGFYFDGEDGLVDKMNEIYNNPDILDGVRKNTYRSIKKYTKESYAKNVFSVYNNAIFLYSKNNCKK